MENREPTTGGFIRINEWPTEYAIKAYESKHYVEAIQVIHGFIENKLQELLILTGSVDFNKEMEDTWDIANQIKLNDCAKVLYVIGQINQTEFQNILNFNSMRNKVIHQLFKEPYDKAIKGVPLNEYDIVYKNGLELCDILQAKSEDKIN